MCNTPSNAIEHVSKYKAIKTDIRVFTNIYRIENKYVKKITFVT